MRLQMIWKRMMMVLGSGFVLAAAFNLTLSFLDNGVDRTVVSLIHYIDSKDPVNGFRQPSTHPR